MFLTVHSAAGLVVGNYVKNPFLAFFVGFILHYLFDIIPHGDTKVSKKYHNVIYMTLAGIIDLAVVISSFLIIILFQNKLFSWSQITAICGSVLPDALLFCYFILPQNKILSQLKKFHHYIHGLISDRWAINLLPGMILQIILYIIILTLYFNIC